MMTKQAELKQQAYASSLKSRALSLLIYLIDRSNNDLTCFPAIPTMARQLHISVSTVKRALKELVDAGYIVKTARFRERNRGQSSNLYTLLFTEQYSEPDDENISSGPSRNYRHTSAVQKLSTDCSIEYITFETLSAEVQATEQGQESKEERIQTVSACTLGNKQISFAPCPPVHMTIMQKLCQSQIL